MSESPPVDLVFLWHHHQPDYRRPSDGRALLPWVRLHATKDYLDMALHLERHPKVRSAFNFVPSLLDQLESAAAGAPDALFELLGRDPSALGAQERRELARRCRAAPRHALERWAAYRRLIERVDRWCAAGYPAPGPADAELHALACWFLLAWIDPMLLDRPEVAAVLARDGAFEPSDRDALLAVHARLLAEVLPAYRRLAARGQVELSCTPYYHPILPLLVDLRAARRARPDLALPSESLTAPGDASRQIARARVRHETAFGAAPAGMWPSEGSVSPEAVELAAAEGVRWMATDEGVLWASLPEGERRRAALYRPWTFATTHGDVALLFRDHELSDRIGFVYARWDPRAAVEDFMGRLRRIAREHAGEHAPLVSVILDGENCWEGYAEDGSPFLEGLYAALEAAPDVRTRTPSEAIASHGAPGRLERLHSGSWIDADFHVWIGHPEKNRAWDLLARTRGELVAAGEAAPAQAWEALDRAEGSDWFWWFGDDHFTADKDLFDQLFREHLRAVHEAIGRPVPAALLAPIGRRRVAASHLAPIGFVRPAIDGRRTDFYEWHAAGRHALGAAGSSMHRAAGFLRELFHGFDDRNLYLRVDFNAPPGPDADLVVELLEPRAAACRVQGLGRGERPMLEGREGGRPLEGARACVDDVLELAVPFASLGVNPGEPVGLVVHVLREGRVVETEPADDVVRFVVPGPAFEAEMWSA